MVLSNMETKPINSQLNKDMNFGQRVMFATTPDQDMKANQDFVIGCLGIAYRRRKFKLSRWNEVSIRHSRASGAKTEHQKILNGECKAQLFIWEFVDVWVISTLADVIDCLDRKVGYSKVNNDGITSAYYININDIKHFVIKKGELVL